MGSGVRLEQGRLHRIAGILALETAAEGIRAFNVQPGFIVTERMIQDMGGFGFDASSGAPPAVVGKVCTWLLQSAEADALNGQTIEAQELCDRLGLLPGWSLTPAGQRARRGSARARSVRRSRRGRPLPSCEHSG